MRKVNGRGRWLLRLAGVLIAAGLLLEGGVRAVVFGVVPADWEPVGALRRGGTYADPNEDLWWLLQRHFGASGLSPEAPRFDPQLGWITAGLVNPVSYDHRARVGLGARRPVLLYGDSFAMGLTPEADCFQGLLERSDLGGRLALMNYGCGGYGLDQIYLSLGRTIDLWADREPLVLFSLLVDDDLDRNLLAFRGWTKPRFDVRGGELALERDELPTSSGHFEREFPPATSWAWRALVRSELLPAALRDTLSGAKGRARRTRELSARLIEATVAELRRRELPFAFVLFHGLDSARSPEQLAWREPFLTELLEELEVPFVLSRVALTEDSQATGDALEDYFMPDGHYNARGNAVVFEPMRNALEALIPAADYDPPPSPWGIAETVLGGRFAGAAFENGIRPPFEAPVDMSRLVLKVGARGPTELHYALSDRASSFTGLAWIPPHERGSATLTLLADGEPLWERRLGAGEPKLPIEVDLAGRQRLVLRADDGGDGYAGDLVVVSAPEFH